MHFVSALDQVPGIRAVLGLHETVCTGAADGYGRMAGKPAMALLHLGPGLANGLANLHNARRARTPTLALVGDMATWHQPADAVLAMDIDSLARTVSEEVYRAGAGGEDFRRLAERAAEARGVTTLVVPHDVSWTRVPAPEDGVKGEGREGSGPGAAPAPPPGTEEFVRDLAAAMRAASRGRLGIYCGGKALIDAGTWVRLGRAVCMVMHVRGRVRQVLPASACQPGVDWLDPVGRDDRPSPRDSGPASRSVPLAHPEGALRLLGQIAAASGADLLCENSFARVDRGHGLPKFRRVPYFPQVRVGGSRARWCGEVRCSWLLMGTKGTLLWQGDSQDGHARSLLHPSSHKALDRIPLQEASAALGKYETLVLVDARRPVANFGYEGGPSQLVTQSVSGLGP